MSAWASKGKGKGKGKSGTPEGRQGHTLPRTRLSAEKFAGTVAEWKGKYGWIVPAEAIEHEKASLRGGRLFVGLNDIEGAESLDAGAPVEFHICEDDSGLGAEEVVQTGDGDPEEAAKLGAKGAKGASGPKGAKGAKGEDVSKGGKGKSPAWGGAKGWAGANGWAGASGWAAPVAVKGAAKGWGTPATAKGVISAFGKGLKGGKDQGKGKGKSKRKEGGKGHLLPKTRLSAEKFTGTVSAWKGKYGWIQPAEEIEHEKAKMHQGGLFVGLNDLEGGLTELTVGATVEFHVCEDDSGLGAEEVVQY